MSANPEPGPVTVGIDIGTTSVKALAVDENGTAVAGARVPHRVLHQSADHLEHDANAAWRRGPRRALAIVRRSVASASGGGDGTGGTGTGGGDMPTGRPIAGICVAGMVPSVTGVDRRGIPRTPGLLYGDVRGRGGSWSAPDDVPGPMPDAEGMFRWTAAEMPGAFGYWPAQAVATHGLSGEAVIDSAVGSTLGNLMQRGGWNESLLEDIGLSSAQLPRVVPTGRAATTTVLPPLTGHPAPGGRGAGSERGFAFEQDEVAVAGGTIDAFCDQIVAGADDVGDVLVIFGATLITWVVTDEWVEIPGVWTVPHTVSGKVLVGGPSNAGALFVDWARSLLRLGRARRGPGPAGGNRAGDGRDGNRGDRRSGDPLRVPVWLPYLRGERVPYHDTSLRAALYDLDITDGPAGLGRAVYEASGFVVRSILDRSGVTGRRIVASGGGTRDRAWMASVADATGLPVDTVAVPEGAALGAAYLARMAAGLEPSLEGSARWARSGGRVLPDPTWREAADRRYRRFCDLGSGR